jgi:hypothetical protein
MMRRGRCLAVALAAILMVALPGAASAKGGSGLDRSFGQGGVVVSSALAPGNYWGTGGAPKRRSARAGGSSSSGTMGSRASEATGASTGPSEAAFP